MPAVSAPTIPDGWPAIPEPEPETGVQLAGLTHLRHIADEQAAAIATTATAAPASAADSPVSRTLRPSPSAWWTLPAILAVQAALSLRLIWSMGAYGDEGLYIWAGHVEWSAWLHGGSLPNFASYFSGAPVVYPPLAALADSAGGLVATRLLSLAFMMGATGLLYLTARRIFNQRTGLCAAVVFVGTGASQFLGAFATFDSMAVFFLALSTWAGVRAAEQPSWWRRTPVLMLVGLLLAMADAAKYVTLLFDPAVVLVAGCWAWRCRDSFRSGMASAATLAASAAGTLGTALYLAPAAYRTGIAFTTTGRQHGTAGAWQILLVAAGWSGAVILLALVGVAAAFCAYHDRATRIMVIVLAGAALVVPAMMARDHLFTSMFKHVGYGELFAAIPAGYVLASFTYAVPRAKRFAAARALAVPVTVAGVIGFLLAGNQYLNIGPNFLHVQSALGTHNAIIAADDVDTTQYYVYNDAPSSRLYVIGPNPADKEQILYYDRRAGNAALPAAIDHGYLTEVILSHYPLWAALDARVERDLESSGKYRLAMSVPYTADKRHLAYQVWVMTK
ncbi:MAG: glycosyltransferase family 39 protein [Nocardiopsaceae bacterium]|nr:glycosyltransferase family 39 protein [Nocardiopsaceae bacterium]